MTNREWVAIAMAVIVIGAFVVTALMKGCG